MDNQVESKIISAIKELETKILYLENKINVLIAKSADKPPRESHFSPSSYEKPQHHHDKRTSRFAGSKGARPSARPFEGKERDRDGASEYTTKKKTFGSGGAGKKFSSKPGAKKKSGGFKGKR